MDVITFPENLLTTSGLSILLHGVISLPDATSYDKRYFDIVYFPNFLTNNELSPKHLQFEYSKLIIQTCITHNYTINNIHIAHKVNGINM